MELNEETNIPQKVKPVVVNISQYILKQKRRGAWVAQLVKCLTLDLGSSLDLKIMGSSPTLGSMMEST